MAPARAASRGGAEDPGARRGGAPGARALALALALACLVAAAAAAPAASAREPLVARSGDGAVEARLGFDRPIVRFARAPAPPVEVPVGGLGTATSLHLDQSGRWAFVTCEEAESAVVVVDGAERRARVVPSGELFSFGERLRVGSPWHEARGAFVSASAPLLFVHTAVGVKAIPALASEEPHAALADELAPCLAWLARGTFPWLTAVRGLDAAGAEGRIEAELDALLGHLIERPHDSRELSLAVYETLLDCFGGDDRLHEPEYVRRLLAAYMRFDRTRVRQLFVRGPGRHAVKPLRDLMEDDAEPMHDRIAAASCLMAVSTFRRTESFHFALAGLDHPSADAREESFAVLAWFSGLELLRYRGEVERALLAALSTDDGRGDRAQKLIIDGLQKDRSRGYAEPLVLDHLARPDLPLAARRALVEALAAPAVAPEEARAVGDRLARELRASDAAVRGSALAALRELRRHVDGIDAPAPFASADEAQAWWEAARARAD